MKINVLTNKQKRFDSNERNLIKNFFRALFASADECTVYVSGKNEFDSVCKEIIAELTPFYDVRLSIYIDEECDVTVAYSEYVLPKNMPKSKLLLIYSE